MWLIPLQKTDTANSHTHTPLAESSNKNKKKKKNKVYTGVKKGVEQYTVTRC